MDIAPASSVGSDMGPGVAPAWAVGIVAFIFGFIWHFWGVWDLGGYVADILRFVCK